MNATWIVTVFVIIDDLVHHLDHRSHPSAQVCDAEVLAVPMVAAKYFHNHHERALAIMQQMDYLSAPLSPARFNRRIHGLANWVEFSTITLGEVFAQGDVFVIDSLPVPACRRARARRCGTLWGKSYCGYCAAKREKFYVWRLDVVRTPTGIPIRFNLLPASLHDPAPIHELLYELPAGTRVFGDKGYNSAKDEATIRDETGVRLVPIRRANMKPHAWFVDELELRKYRHTIETVNSQLESMDIQRLHVRTNAGRELKVHASLLALICTNFG